MRLVGCVLLVHKPNQPSNFKSRFSGRLRKTNAVILPLGSHCDMMRQSSMVLPGNVHPIFSTFSVFPWLTLVCLVCFQAEREK